MSTKIILICTDCGHTGAYATRALADYHFSRHSCAQVQQRHARAARRLARLAGQGERRDCQCKKAQHQHGTRTAYIVDKCRCHPCKVSARVYEQQRKRRIAYGRDGGWVNAEPARQHMRRLMAQGMGWKRIAAAAGVAPSTLYLLLYGKHSTDPRECRPPRRKILKGNAEAVLAVRLDLAPGALIDGTGTARRIQALVAVGWSMSKISEELGILRGNFTAIAHGRRQITVGTAHAVRALYDQWWNRTPPKGSHRDKIAYSRSVNLARDYGWVPPLAWDDDLIDDPTASPYTELEVRRANHAAVEPEDVEWILDQDASRTELAARLGVKESSLQNLLERAGRRDLWRRIVDRENLRRTAPRWVA